MVYLKFSIRRFSGRQTRITCIGPFLQMSTLCSWAHCEHGCIVCRGALCTGVHCENGCFQCTILIWSIQNICKPWCIKVHEYIVYMGALCTWVHCEHGCFLCNSLIKHMQNMWNHDGKWVHCVHGCIVSMGALCIHGCIVCAWVCWGAHLTMSCYSSQW